MYVGLFNKLFPFFKKKRKRTINKMLMKMSPGIDPEDLSLLKARGRASLIWIMCWTATPKKKNSAVQRS